MVTFRSNTNRRPNFRRNDRNFKRTNDSSKFKSDYSQPSNFQRRTPGRNNNNASNLIEKYSDLAREALTNEDQILSENYFQHADHFTRILNEQKRNVAVQAVESSKPVEKEINNSKPIEVEDQKEQKNKI